MCSTVFPCSKWFVNLFWRVRLQDVFRDSECFWSVSHSRSTIRVRWSGCSCICRIRFPWPLQWGPPTFDAGHTFGIMAGALAALVEVNISPDPLLLPVFTSVFWKSPFWACVSYPISKSRRSNWLQRTCEAEANVPAVAKTLTFSLRATSTLCHDWLVFRLLLHMSSRAE